CAVRPSRPCGHPRHSAAPRRFYAKMAGIGDDDLPTLHSGSDLRISCWGWPHQLDRTAVSETDRECVRRPCRRQPNFAGPARAAHVSSNYLIICAPPLILFGAAAFARIHRAALSGALVLLLILLAAIPLVDYYRHDPAENWRDATRYVPAAASAADGIAFYPGFARMPFDYYTLQAKFRRR